MAKNIKPFVRHIYDLGDFNDDEVNNEPSLTDPEQDEPIARLLDKMLKGQAVNGSNVVFDDIDGKSDDEALAGLDPTEVKGFDLADAPEILEAAKAAQAELDKPAPVPAPKPAEPEVTPAPPPVPDQGK